MRLTYKRKFAIIIADTTRRKKMITLNEYETLEDMMIGDLKIVQDTRLYRFTSDSVLLSRFARAKRNDTVADFCSGSGIVAFHFYALQSEILQKHLSFTLFEIQTPLAELSKKTIAINGFSNFTVENLRLQEIPEKYREKFSLILCNPPYERGGFDNETYEKAVCRKELTLTLPELAKAAAKCLKFGGRFALVHRADRLAELCYTLKEVGLEVKRLAFVAGKEGDKPYLVLLEAVKGGKPATEILPTVVNKSKK